jgi:hypothetical protein
MAEEKRPAYDIRNNTADAYAWLLQFDKPQVKECQDGVTVRMLAMVGQTLLRALDELYAVRAELAAFRGQASEAEPGAAPDSASAFDFQ